MADAALVDPSDRLPWLNDTKRAQPTPRRSWLVPAAAGLASGLALATAGWVLLDRGAAPQTEPVRTVERIALPAPQSSGSQDVEPQRASAAEREALEPVAEPTQPKRAAPAQKRRRTHAAQRPAKTEAAEREPAQTAANSAGPRYEPRAWQSGVPGRIIQVGAFRSPAQANAQWRRVYYRYPLLRPLPPRVVRTNVRGKTYYRLQLGTFSQAHSELLCQRLRAVGEGCIVLGLPKRVRSR
jgi:hypothetical protein